MSIRKVEKVSGIGSTRCSTSSSRDERKNFREALEKAAKKRNFDVSNFSKKLGSEYNKEIDER